MIGNWIGKLTGWLQRTFGFLKGHPTLTLALAVIILAAIIISPIPPVP